MSLLGGELAILRNVARMIGVGFLAASVLGGYLSWFGPIAYLALAEKAISSGWQSPWTWPARPADDVGAVILCGRRLCCCRARRYRHMEDASHLS